MSDELSNEATALIDAADRGDRHAMNRLQEMSKGPLTDLMAELVEAAATGNPIVKRVFRALSAERDPENFKDRICCLCRMPYNGFGYNPEPVVEMIDDETRCCDRCNETTVRAARAEGGK